MDKIADNVYISSKAKVGHFLEDEWDGESIGILSIGDFDNPRWKVEYGDKVTHKHIGNIDDDDSEKIANHANEIASFIDQQSHKKSKVLVHCWAGRNRSATAIAAWLILKKKYDANRAISTIEAKHPETNIWDGNQKMLKTLG